MFKNATLYRYSGALTDAPAFQPTLPTQQRSIGFINTPGDGLACVQLERRTVPAAQVAKRVDALAAAIERDTGRKPGKKHRRDLADEALLELLPHAFPKQTKVLVWTRPDGLLVLDSASATVADEVSTLLAQCGVTLSLVAHETGQRTSGWLWAQDVAHEAFEFDGACVLGMPQPGGKVVKYKNTDLTIPEVSAHVTAGLRCEALALSWDGGEVGFTLTSNLVLKGLKFAAPLTGEWDGDVVLFKAAMGAMLDDLLVAVA